MGHLIVEILHHLGLVARVGFDDGIVHGAGEITQHDLLGRIVGHLVHDMRVLPHLVGDGVGVVDQVVVGQAVGDKDLVQTADDLGEPRRLLVARFAGEGVVAEVGRGGPQCWR